MAQTFKTGTDQSNFLQKDFAKRIGRNPAYRQMAQYARGDDQDISDDYFYAFKDAYEQSPDFARNNLMMENDIGARLSDRYYKLLDDDYEAHGITPDGSYENDSKYEKWYGPQFEKKYGTHDDFVKKTTDAWKRWMTENYGGYDEDHQSLGRYIVENLDKLPNRDALEEYFKGWAGEGYEDYDDYFDFWRNKLFGGQK